jgi:23S rRNA (uracil1939-C5)-methyltransferase
MAKKNLPVVNVTLDKIVGGGQALATMDDGRKLFVWGGLPGETVSVQITKRKSKFAEGIVTKVTKASPDRVEPRDPDSYLSTSPWQIMDFTAEQHYKSALIEEAFELHDIVLPNPITVFTDDQQYEYRNKIEYSFWYDTDKNRLDLAFFRRGTHGKIAVDKTSLASPAITELSKKILKTLNSLKIEGRALKTLMIRSNHAGQTAWQLYVKDKNTNLKEIVKAQPNGEVIYSDPRSPASVITERLTSSGELKLSDQVLDVPFQYTADSFFQINLPVYQQALTDLKQWLDPKLPTIDLYSGVGTIGLTIGSDNLTLIETNPAAINEMRQNVKSSNKNAKIIHANAESALEYLSSDQQVIVDPPRAGLHQDVVDRLLDASPKRIVYLSCNPVTQARDTALLGEKYGIAHHQGYKFFPRTPHIEHLIILDLKT